MILAIDAGNTRVKWGLWHSGAGAATIWHAVGALANADLDATTGGLSEQFAALPLPSRVIVANVGGAVTRAAIERALGAWRVSVDWMRASARCAGVTNSYDVPASLGTDRWAALIGAHARGGAPAVVVNCGTATTIDRLDADGTFIGGMIMPGLALMKRALADHTAGLGRFEGRYSRFPRNTADAIESGCMTAQLGAIEHACRELGLDRDEKVEQRGEQRPAKCIVTGGAAARLAGELGCAHELAEHLTLEGLIRMAE